MQQFDPNLLPDMLPVYYNRLFPQKIFCRWVTCGCSPQPMANREISFTLADDIYLRYLSFSNLKELQAMLQKKCPHKIDIGAVYNVKPSIARHGAVVVARELVFDIDLTDYDDVRTCCQEAKVCSKCWKFMTVACKIIDVALRDDFGFSNVLWVFSGRRGIHCWVSDYDARMLDGPGRSAVADYLCLVSGGENQSKKVHLPSDSLHSSIRRAHRIIGEHFDEILQDQNFLSTPEGLKKFISMIPDESLSGQVEKHLIQLPSESKIRWDAFVQLYQDFWKESGTRRIKNLIEEIQIQWCYPRLDVNVTKGSNHLLKSPFSIHPKTGNVCIIFRPSNAQDMNLDEVPRLQVLLEESSPDHGVQQKNMQAAIKLFQEHVFALEKEEAKRKRLADTSIDF